MFRHLFTGHSELGFYPAIALVIFMTIFILVLVRVVRMSKGEVEYLSRLPLDSSKSINSGE